MFVLTPAEASAFSVVCQTYTALGCTMARLRGRKLFGSGDFTLPSPRGRAPKPGDFEGQDAVR